MLLFDNKLNVLSANIRSLEHVFQEKVIPSGKSIIDVLFSSSNLSKMQKALWSST